MQVAIEKRSFLDDPHCGDECAWWQNKKETTLCVVDGLGKGKEAEEAAKAAVDYVARHVSDGLPKLFEGCNWALRRTRGVAMGIAIIDDEAGTLTYAGIGNTRAMIVGERTIRLSSNPGIVGGGYRKLTPETVPLMPGHLVIMATDGIKERFEHAFLASYSGEQPQDVKKLAKRILQEGRRKTDDAAVLAFRKS